MSSRDSVVLPTDLLKGLDTARLEEISENESKFVEYFSELELDDIKRINNERNAITNSNRELALEIMNKKPEYEAKKSKLIDASLMANEFKVAYEQKLRQLKNLSSSMDQTAVLDDLREGIKTAEREAEDLADTFMDGTLQLTSDDFIKQFMSHRNTYWLRKVKAEKMDELLKQPTPYPSSDPVSSIPIPKPRSSIPSMPVPAPRHHSLTPTSAAPPASSLPPKQQSVPESLSQASQPPPPSYNSLQPAAPNQSYYSPGSGGGMPVPRSPQLHRPAPGPPMPRPGYPPTSNYQPPTSNYQPPTSNYQPPTSNYQPPTSNYQPPTSNYQYGNPPPPVGPPTSSYNYYPPQQRPPPRQPYPPPQQQQYTPPQYGGYQRR